MDKILGAIQISLHRAFDDLRDILKLLDELSDYDDNDSDVAHNSGFNK